MIETSRLARQPRHRDSMHVTLIAKQLAMGHRRVVHINRQLSVTTQINA